MRSLDQTVSEQIMRTAGVRARLRRELRFVPGEDEDYQAREMLAVTNRSAKNGLLLIELDGGLYAVPYEMASNLRDASGRAKPVICDLCYTWQRGGNVGRITFALDEHRTLTFVCCADLQCSLHVRSKTSQSALSRTQLHEDITTERRTERLHAKLSGLVKALGLQPVLA